MALDYKEIGRRIAQRRRDLKLKQITVSERAGISDKYLSNIEHRSSHAFGGGPRHHAGHLPCRHRARPGEPGVACRRAAPAPHDAQAARADRPFHRLGHPRRSLTGSPRPTGPKRLAGRFLPCFAPFGSCCLYLILYFCTKIVYSICTIYTNYASHLWIFHLKT